MAATEKDIAHWTARVAELEQQLDAATKLSKINMIAGELMCSRKALKDAKAKPGSAVRHPKHASSPPSARRSVSNAGELVSSSG
jgi:hypothetical protein